MKRAGRGIKVVVTDDISHMGVTEEEYKVIENSLEAKIMKNREERLEKREKSKERTKRFLEGLDK